MSAFAISILKPAYFCSLCDLDSNPFCPIRKEDPAEVLSRFPKILLAEDPPLLSSPDYSYFNTAGFSIGKVTLFIPLVPIQEMRAAFVLNHKVQGEPAEPESIRVRTTGACTPNTTEEGRARNRRVELVEQ